MTDGSTVVYRQSTPCCQNQQYGIAGNRGSGELVLAPLNTRNEPLPPWDYQVANGWIAYTRPGGGVSQVWLQAPDGTQRQISAFGTDSRMRGIPLNDPPTAGSALAGNGELTFVSNQQRYLSRAGAGLVNISSDGGWSFQQNGQWYVAMGRVLFSVQADGPRRGLTLLQQPQRLVDTRLVGGPIASGSSRCFQVAGTAGVPVDASAVLLNVSAVGQTQNGWLTVFANGQTLPATSTLNFGTSEYAMANGTIMRIGASGQVCVNIATQNSLPGSANVIPDVAGFVPANTAGDIVTLPSPVRLSDTRLSTGPISTGTSRCLQVTGVGGIPANAAAAILNVTAVES